MNLSVLSMSFSMPSIYSDNENSDHDSDECDSDSDDYVYDSNRDNDNDDDTWSRVYALSLIYTKSRTSGA